jgi:hypothetical protein
MPMLMKNLIFTISIFLFFTNSIFAQSVLHVSSLATGANNGNSWANAFTNLQDALVSAQYGDTIKVAQGTYKPTIDTNRDSAFHLPNGVKLLGGYAGNSSNPNLRNWNTFQTILSGDIGVLGDDTDNSYHVMESYQLDSTSVLEGFVVEKGRADGPYEGFNKVGGALVLYGFLDSDIRPLIQHCIFRDNFAQSGGALYLYGAYYNSKFNPVIQYCRFERNQALSLAGAAFIKYRNYGDTATLHNCYFFENEGVSVAALSINSENVALFKLEMDTFVRNNAQELAVEFNGGVNIFNDIELNDCYFEENSCSYIANIFYYKQFSANNLTFKKNITNYDLFLSNNLMIKLNNISFLNGKNGGLYSTAYYESHLNKIIVDSVEHFFFRIGATSSNNPSQTNTKQIIENSRFSNSGISSWTETFNQFNLPTDSFQYCFNNCIFNNNSYYYTYFQSLGLQLYRSNLSYNFCTFHNNSAPTDSLFFDLPNYDTTTFNSCIFSTDISKPNYVKAYDNTVKFTNCMFTDENTDNWFPPNAPNQNVTFDASNIFGAMPHFEDPNINNFRLTPCSVGVNQGNPNSSASLLAGFDYSGQQRVLQGLPDIGAFETSEMVISDVFATIFPANINNGEIHINSIVGGIAPFTYTWSNGSNLASQTDLIEGVYLLTITDALGCSKEFSYFVPLSVKNTEILLESPLFFPNPVHTSAVVFLQNMKKTPIAIKVFDAAGRLMNVLENGNFSSFQSPEKQGVYFVQFINKDGEFAVQKLLVY